MRFSIVLALLVAACAQIPQQPKEADFRSLAIVPVAYEPPAKSEEAKKGYTGAVLGAGGGALAGGAMAYGSAGLMCTIGGPLCAVVVIPAAIVGGLVGGLAGGAIDAATDPTKRNAAARKSVAEAIAKVKPADALAEQAYRRAREDTPTVVLAQPKTEVRSLASQGASAALEVEVTGFNVLAKESEMAVEVRGRSRLYRTADGAFLGEYETSTQTAYRKYEEWAADEGRPLRRALEHAFGDVGDALVAGQVKSRLRADTSARQGG